MSGTTKQLIIAQRVANLLAERHDLDKETENPNWSKIRECQEIAQRLTATLERKYLPSVIYFLNDSKKMEVEEQLNLLESVIE